MDFRRLLSETFTSSKPIIPSPPAYERLLKSFDRWQCEVRRGDNIGSAPNFLLNVDLNEFEKKHLLPPVPNVIRALQLLTRLDPTTLSEQQCSICLEPFRSSDDKPSAQKSESTERSVSLPGSFQDSYEVFPAIPYPPFERPIRLPGCGHVFGSSCLSQWIWPFGNSTTCPMCRAKPFANHKDSHMCGDIGHSTQYEDMLDELVWSDFEGGHPRTAETRAWVRRNRYKIVHYRVQEALKESIDEIPKPSSSHTSVKEWQQRKLQIIDIDSTLTKALEAYNRDVSMSEMYEEFELDTLVDEDEDEDEERSDAGSWDSFFSDQHDEDGTLISSMIDDISADGRSISFTNQAGEDTTSGPKPSQTLLPLANRSGTTFQTDVMENINTRDDIGESEDEAWTYTTDGRR